MTTHVRQDLSNQSFAGQDLRGWSFEQCNLSGCDFHGATTDETTVLFDCNIAGIWIDFGTRSFDALLVKCYGKSAEFKKWQRQTPEERRVKERRYWNTKRDQTLVRQTQRRVYLANRQQRIEYQRLYRKQQKELAEVGTSPSRSAGK